MIEESKNLRIILMDDIITYLFTYKINVYKNKISIEK